jgi:hypothetical protein
MPRAKKVSRRKKRQRSKPPAYKNKRTGGYIDIEKKFKDEDVDQLITNDMSLANSLADPGPNLRPLNGIAQGDDQDQRIGRVTYLKSIHLKGRVVFAAAFTAGVAPITHKVRLLLVLDKQANGASITASNVLSDPGATGMDVEAHYKPENVSRFTILRDFTLDEGVNAGFYDGSQLGKTATVRSFSIDHTFKSPLKVVHVGATDTFGTITTNQIHLIALADNTSSQLRYVSRVHFYDP